MKQRLYTILLTLTVALLLMVILCGSLIFLWLARSGRLQRLVDVFLVQEHQVVRSEQEHFNLTVIANNLHFPWDIAFIPDSSNLLVTEKLTAQIILINTETTGGEFKVIARIPDVMPVGIGSHCGLLGISLHPNFNENGYVYMTYASSGLNGKGIQHTIARARYHNQALFDLETILSIDSNINTPSEYITSTHAIKNTIIGSGTCGMRMAWLPDTTLLVTIGSVEYETREIIQRFDNLRGKIIRINDDGTVPADNPFVNDPEISDEIFSVGHRDAQGLTVSRESPYQIWSSEHGPYGGDELNLIVPGANYGWPLVSYGYDYRERSTIVNSLEFLGLLNRLPPQTLVRSALDDNHAKYGFQEPVRIWGRDGGRSVAPSGLMWYSGALFKNWKGNLFMALLYKRQLLRLVVENNQVIHEEGLLTNQIGRIRHVAEGFDGAIYLIVDQDRGRLYRMTPR